MGKKTFLFIVSVLLLLNVQAQKKRTDLSEQNLQEKVRTLEEFEYNAETRDGIVSIDQEMGATSHHLTTYNRHGNIEEDSVFSEFWKKNDYSGYWSGCFI